MLEAGLLEPGFEAVVSALSLRSGEPIAPERKLLADGGEQAGEETDAFGLGVHPAILEVRADSSSTMPGGAGARGFVLMSGPPDEIARQLGEGRIAGDTGYGEGRSRFVVSSPEAFFDLVGLGLSDENEPVYK